MTLQLQLKFGWWWWCQNNTFHSTLHKLCPWFKLVDTFMLQCKLLRDRLILIYFWKSSFLSFVSVCLYTFNFKCFVYLYIHLMFIIITHFLFYDFPDTWFKKYILFTDVEWDLKISVFLAFISLTYKLGILLFRGAWCVGFYCPCAINFLIIEMVLLFIHICIP